MPSRKPLFDLGSIYSTPGALKAFEEAGADMLAFIARHVTGDWSEMDDADQQENWLSVEEGYRVFSAYRLKTGVKIWIITEADRSATTVLLPEEY